MPELALHFAVPFALTAPKLGLRRALLVSFIALLPDLDALLGFHRSMSHSLVILSAVGIPVLLAVYRFKREHFGLALVGLLALLSHPVMDGFQTYTPLLYPIYERSIWVRVEGGIQFQGGLVRPEVSAAVGEVPTVFSPFETLDAPIFTSEGLSISLMLLAPTLLMGLRPPRPRGLNPINPGLGDLRLEGASTAIGDESPLGADEVTVVIPTLNEEEAIGPVLEELRGEGYRNILVVDGWSRDRTVEIAEGMGAIVVMQHGSGKAGALRTAFELVKTPYILVMDGDYTYSARDIERFLPFARRFDQVLGCRSIGRENLGLLHRFGNYLISSAVRILYGAPVSDACTGMYMLRTEAARRLTLGSRGFDVEAEILIQNLVNGMVTEVPISFRKRLGRRKLSTWREGFQILWTIFRLSITYNPILTFSALGSLFTIPGILTLLMELYNRLMYGEAGWSTGRVWLGLILLIIGLNSFTIATLTLLLKRLEQRITKQIKTSRS